MEWKPIETAPEGEILVIGGIIEGELGSAYDCISAVKARKYGDARESYEQQYDVCHTCYYSVWVNNPTHWMPLPEPPNL